MRAKSGRPAKPKEKPPRPAVKLALPRGLTTAQRRHVAALAANCSEQSLLDEYAKALVLRDKCAALVEAEPIVKTERGATKAHPASQMLKDANLQMLAIRRLIERPKEPQPATPAAGSAAEQRIQNYLAGDEMEWLIDDQGEDPPGDSSWRSDPRVIEKRRRIQ